MNEEGSSSGELVPDKKNRSPSSSSRTPPGSLFAVWEEYMRKEMDAARAIGGENPSRGSSSSSSSSKSTWAELRRDCPRQPSAGEEEAETKIAGREFSSGMSAIPADRAFVTVKTEPETEERPTGEDSPVPAVSESYKIPGTRSWNVGRTRALIDRASATGVRGVQPRHYESLFNQRFVRSARTWVGVTTKKDDGVRARCVPMNGPVPRRDSDTRQQRYVDWELPRGCCLRFAGVRPADVPGLRLYPGNLRGLGFPEEAVSAFDAAKKKNERFEVFSLQWMRLSTLQAVAVEDLLKTLRDRFEGTEHYDALLPAVEDVADLTALQCNRAATAAYAVCREVRHAVLEAVHVPFHVRTHYQDAPFSTKLFDGPPHPSAPFEARRRDGDDLRPVPERRRRDGDEDDCGGRDGVKRRRLDGSCDDGRLDGRPRRDSRSRDGDTSETRSPRRDRGGSLRFSGYAETRGDRFDEGRDDRRRREHSSGSPGRRIDVGADRDRRHRSGHSSGFSESPRRRNFSRDGGGYAERDDENGKSLGEELTELVEKVLRNARRGAPSSSFGCHGGGRGGGWRTGDEGPSGRGRWGRNEDGHRRSNLQSDLGRDDLGDLVVDIRRLVDKHRTY